LEKLIELGILHPPELLPTYCDDAAARQRLAQVRKLPLSALYQCPSSEHLAQLAA